MRKLVFWSTIATAGAGAGVLIRRALASGVPDEPPADWRARFYPTSEPGVVTSDPPPSAGTGADVGAVPAVSLVPDDAPPVHYGGVDEPQGDDAPDRLP